MKNHIDEDSSETLSETEMEDNEPQNISILNAIDTREKKPLTSLGSNRHEKKQDGGLTDDEARADVEPSPPEEMQGGELTDQEIILDIIKLVQQNKFTEAKKEIEKSLGLLKIINKVNILLEEATSRGEIDFLKWLHEKNVNLNIHNEGKNDLTHIAAERGYLAILKWFSSIKIPLNNSGKEGVTLSFLASRGGHTEVVKWLAEKSHTEKSNSEVEIVEKIQDLNIQPEPPFHQAVYAVSHLKNDIVFKILMPIFEAIKTSDPKTTQILIKTDKANLATKKSGVLSLLDNALKYGQFDVAKYLAINGGNPEDIFPNRVKPCFINTDEIFCCDKDLVDIIIRVKKTCVTYEQEIRASDTDSLCINGPVTFKEQVKVSHCRIHKDLCEHTLPTYVATDKPLQFGEIVFEKGLHCSDIQMVGELAHIQVNDHYYI